jgi:23S rRNA pseudouridine2605 synthase
MLEQRHLTSGPRRKRDPHLIAEQLQTARAAHWRQQNNPLLTLEDAERWLEQHPLCLFLPRPAQLPAPAPSFVEACLGRADVTPSGEAISHAHGLLTRLTAAGTVVPLNLLGTAGEQSDFLATRVALPFVLSLRAERDWKSAPQKSSGHRVSPLVIELWKLLDEKGALTAEEARAALGRELTEAAVLRALAELWQGLRISPVYGQDGEPARWEMMQLHHEDALITARNTGQVTALSLLVSMYLQSVYAATSEEIEIFLSPVASRSRAREAVRGLSATRQIHSLSMGAQTYYFLKDGLPEFATATVANEEAPPLPTVASVEQTPESPVAGGGWKSPQRSGRPQGDRGGAGSGERGEGRPPFRPRTGPDQRRGSGKPPWRPKQTADPSTPLRSGRDDRERGAARSGQRAEGRPSFRPRTGPDQRRGSGKAPWRPKQTADPSAPLRSGRDDRESGAARSGQRGEGRPPFKPRMGPDQKRGSGKPPWRPKQTADPSTPPRSGRDGREIGGSRSGQRGEGRPPFKPRSGPDQKRGSSKAPWRPKQTAGPSASLRSGRDARESGADRSGQRGEGRPPFKPRSGAEQRRSSGKAPWRPKRNADRSAPLRSGRDDKSRWTDRSGERGEERPSFKSRTGPEQRHGSGQKPSRPGAPRTGGAPARRDGGSRPPFRRPGASQAGPRKFDKDRPGRRSAPRKKPDA